MLSNSENDNGDWLMVVACPACGGTSNDSKRLKLSQYPFAGKSIPLPAGGVSVSRCRGCDLVYKSPIPSKRFISEIFQGSETALWKNSYDYADELSLIETHSRVSDPDVIDIGAADGSFVRALAGAGRRSALDIFVYDDMEISNGELIISFLDETISRWSKSPYDVVTAFDILEHLYDPPAALENLLALTKPGGIVIIETGDTSNNSLGFLSRWYYLGLVEHHIAWNVESIAKWIAGSDFYIEYSETKRHKLAAANRIFLIERMRFLAFHLFGSYYHNVMKWIGLTERLPSWPSSKDHVRVVLRRSGGTRS